MARERAGATAPERVVIVGRGRVGTALARALAPLSVVTRVPGRAPSARAIRRADVVVLAVPDPAVTSVASRIANSVARGAVVLHVAGALGIDALASCAAAGAHVGVMHPLVSFASATRAPSLEGATLVIDGDRAARAAARSIARVIGARALVAPLHGPAYHAAAALVANGAAALATVAVDVLVARGAKRVAAERAVGALLGSVAQNVATVGVPAALTGPIVRGDAAAVTRHREALRASDRAALATYDAVAPAILEAARRAGLSADDARRVRAALKSTSR